MKFSPSVLVVVLVTLFSARSARAGSGARPEFAYRPVFVGVGSLFRSADSPPVCLMIAFGKLVRLFDRSVENYSLHLSIVALSADEAFRRLQEQAQAFQAPSGQSGPPGFGFGALEVRVDFKESIEMRYDRIFEKTSLHKPGNPRQSYVEREGKPDSVPVGATFEAEFSDSTGILGPVPLRCLQVTPMVGW